MPFPYTSFQIEEVVKAAKHPRDWITPEFSNSGGESRRLDAQLEREDQRADRIRLVVVIGQLRIPASYRASLLLEDVRIRGIDYHETARSRFYKEVIPAGWHEDIIDPNAVYTRKRPQLREAIEDFDPFDPPDFLHKACRRWNIALPPTDKTLL